MSFPESIIGTAVICCEIHIYYLTKVLSCCVLIVPFIVNIHFFLYSVGGTFTRWPETSPAIITSTRN